MHHRASLVLVLVIACKKPAPVVAPAPEPAPAPRPAVVLEAPPEPERPYPTRHWATIELASTAATIHRVGDLDGDGRADLAIADSSAGAVGVFFGATLAGIADGASPEPDRIVRGRLATDQFGASVADVGDLDGDGTADLLVGAPAHRDAGGGTGAVWLFLGSTIRDVAEPTSEHAWTYFHGSSRDRVGKVHALGDLDGDGRSEAMMLSRSRGYMLRGAELAAFESFFLPDANQLIVGTAEESADFDPFVAPAGDTLGNTWGGAMFADPSIEGPVWLMHGNQLGTGRVLNLRETPWARFDAPGHFLQGAIGAADLNRDGRPDPIVGWYQDGYVLSVVDAGYLVQPTTIDLATQAMATIRSTAKWAVASVATLGDLDGDGVDEIAVGTRMEGGSTTARVCVFRGASLRARVDATLDDCDAAFDYPIDHQAWWWTTTVIAPGDLDGDGVPDLVVAMQGRGWDDPARKSEVDVVVHRSPWAWRDR